MDVEALKKAKQVTEKNIDELAKKSDLNPSETKAFKDALELLDLIECKMQECEMKENGYSQYSGAGEMGYATPRRYNIVSYARPRGRMSYGPPMMYDEAYCGPMYYGDESMMSRRSMNGGMTPGYYADSMRGYSGHSVKDRAIACLEKEFGTSGSEYELQQLHRYTDLIRSTE